MHLYWRIIEELKYLSESLVFHNPSLKRSYEVWVRKKADVLAMLEKDNENETSRFLQSLSGFQGMN